jgi:hypothetical protein
VFQVPPFYLPPLKGKPMADKKKKFNKAAFLRELLTDTPRISWKDVQAHFKLKDQTVTQAQFYQVRTAMKGGSGGMNGVPKKRRISPAAAGKQTGKSQLLSGVAKKSVSSNITGSDIDTILAVDARLAMAHGELVNLTGCSTQASTLLHNMVNKLCGDRV